MSVHWLPRSDLLRARRRTEEPMTRQEFGRLAGRVFGSWSETDEAYRRYLAVLARRPVDVEERESA